MKPGQNETIFSDHAHCYEAYRPTYPDALFGYLASLVAARDLALDCATGNGQAALKLTPHFQSILAIDASPQQLAWATTKSPPPWRSWQTN
jgi:ubiquinone/menaquinone biosynthesis C-methylase UbiE